MRNDVSGGTVRLIKCVVCTVWINYSKILRAYDMMYGKGHIMKVDDGGGAILGKLPISCQLGGK